MSLVQKTRESSTMQIVLPAAIVLILKFAFAGVKYGELEMPPMGAGEFGLAFAAVLAVWLQREWRSAKFKTNVQQD